MLIIKVPSCLLALPRQIRWIQHVIFAFAIQPEKNWTYQFILNPIFPGSFKVMAALDSLVEENGS
jgi:hypothetical protein